MHIHPNAKFIIPITIVSLILLSLLIPKNDQNADILSEVQLIEPEKTPSNPSPENIQVLGVQDITPSPTPIIKENDQFDPQVLYRLINSYREENELNKLSVNNSLEESARQKLNEMIANENFKHEDVNQNGSWYLFVAAGYQYKYAGENLSFNNNTEWQTFSSWQKSPTHNDQLLKPEFADMGLAVNCRDYKIGRESSCIVVLHLGAK